MDTFFLNILCIFLGAIFLSTVLSNIHLKRKISVLEQLTMQLHFSEEYDLLTGVMNRNALIRFINSFTQNCRFSILVCDIDGLKLINDNLGHMVGDEFIKQTAIILRQSCPKSSQIYRTGGDEFLIFIPEIFQTHRIHNICDVIRADVAAYNRQRKNAPLSLSVGFAISNCKTTLEHVIERADFQMYYEKKTSHEKVYEYFRNEILN